eukprot:jgi/Galph1/6076/GphlegSOOS_G4711.1
MYQQRHTSRPCCFSETAVWTKARRVLILTTTFRRTVPSVVGRRNSNITQTSSTNGGSMSCSETSILQEEISSMASTYSLNESISFEGEGLHSGEEVKVIVSPTRPGHGISFLYEDKNGLSFHIPLRPSSIVSTELCTTICATDNPWSRVATVEHLLAALWGCGIGNALIKVEGNEIPILDGSAINFVEAFEAVGYKRISNNAIRSYRVKQPITVEDGRGSWVRLEPPKEEGGITVEVTIDFPHGAIGRQTFKSNSVITKSTFIKEIASARTFCLETDIEKMKSRNLCRGGSLSNAIVFSRDNQSVLNREGLRFADEPVRHKVLDVFGDLFISGAFLVGHYSAYKPGHRLNAQLVRLLARQMEQEREKVILSEEVEQLTSSVNDRIPLVS